MARTRCRGKNRLIHQIVECRAGRLAILSLRFRTKDTYPRFLPPECSEIDRERIAKSDKSPVVSQTNLSHRTRCRIQVDPLWHEGGFGPIDPAEELEHIRMDKKSKVSKIIVSEHHSKIHD